MYPMCFGSKNLLPFWINDKGNSCSTAKYGKNCPLQVNEYKWKQWTKKIFVGGMRAILGTFCKIRQISTAFPTISATSDAETAF